MKDSIEISCANCKHHGVCTFSPTSPTKNVPFLPFRKGAYETQVLNKFMERTDRAYAEACSEYLPNDLQAMVTKLPERSSSAYLQRFNINSNVESFLPFTDAEMDAMRGAVTILMSIVLKCGSRTVNLALAELEAYPEFIVSVLKCK